MLSNLEKLFLTVSVNFKITYDSLAFLELPLSHVNAIDNRFAGRQTRTRGKLFCLLEVSEVFVYVIGAFRVSRGNVTANPSVAATNNIECRAITSFRQMFRITLDLAVMLRVNFEELQFPFTFKEAHAIRWLKRLQTIVGLDDTRRDQDFDFPFSGECKNLFRLKNHWKLISWMNREGLCVRNHCFLVNNQFQFKRFRD